MNFFCRRKVVPREVNLAFQGLEVKRIQFNRSGGFTVTAYSPNDGKELGFFVPNDPRNEHCRYIREWMANGGFPEDPDPLPTPRTLWISHSTWTVIRHVLLVVAAVVASTMAVISILAAK
jgi:hypothetical protein